jgi:hypothetical protein
VEERDKPLGWHPDMSDAEAADLKKLQDEQQRLKIACYYHMASLNEMTVEELKHSGYGGKTNAEAMQDGFKRAQKQINDLIKKHIQKYPD